MVESILDMTQAVWFAAQELVQSAIAESKLDANAAISFVVLISACEWKFDYFHNWFLDLEDGYLVEYEEEDPYDVFVKSQVTLAPFHPDWAFVPDDDSDDNSNKALDFEKRSPYPTVTLVCRHVIDRAGEAATRQIADHNQEVLISKGFEQLQALYQTKVRLKEE
jgi:hypothetical protein